MDAEWLRMLSTVVSYTLLPIRYILISLFYVLRWLLTPLLLLGRLVVAVLMFPIHFFAQFETFFIFFGVAVAVGVIFGLSLHVLLRGAAHLLGLDCQVPSRSIRSSHKRNAAVGHSAASYRAALGKKRLEEAQRRAAQARVLMSKPLLGLAGTGKENRIGETAHLSPTTPRQRVGLLSTTILEEVDDSEEDYDF